MSGEVAHFSGNFQNKIELYKRDFPHLILLEDKMKFSVTDRMFSRIRKSQMPEMILFEASEERVRFKI